MLTIMITLLVIIGLSTYLVTMSYMRTRDVLARDANNDGLNEVLDRQKYSLILHIIAVLIMVAYIGKLMAV